MNIFYYETDPVLIARYACNKHVGKMAIESAQLLSSAHEYHGGDPLVKAPRSVRNHPCAVYTRASKENYSFVYRLMMAYLEESSQRYGRTHSLITLYKAHEKLEAAPVLLNATRPFYEPPKVMPIEYSVGRSTVDAYRVYYAIGKAHLHAWTSPGERAPWIDKTREAFYAV